MSDDIDQIAAGLVGASGSKRIADALRQQREAGRAEAEARMKAEDQLNRPQPISQQQIEALTAAITALVTDWREQARRIRPLEAAKLTAQKRQQGATYIHLINRANELAAVLEPAKEATFEQCADELEAKLRGTE